MVLTSPIRNKQRRSMKGLIQCAFIVGITEETSMTPETH